MQMRKKKPKPKNETIAVQNKRLVMGKPFLQPVTKKDKPVLLTPDKNLKRKNCEKPKTKNSKKDEDAVVIAGMVRSR